MAWAARQLECYPGVIARVLDIGALDVNGTVRPLFPDAQVIGVDMRAGGGVDYVMEARAIPDHFCHGSFDVVTCTEMLEHDPTPWLTFTVIATMLHPGGLALLTARGVSSAGVVFGRHDHPGDWFRFLQGTLPMMCEQVGLIVLDETEDWEAPGWFVAATKP